jgi:CheY-like chemotaxis protein
MIIGFCEMIVNSPQLYGKDLPPAIFSDLTVVLRNSQHLESLINDVLDLSQIEAGHMALSRERSQLAEIVHAAVTAVKPLYESKKLYIKENIPLDLPEIYCDATRIRQVVLNLISNAGRFTNQGGVTIEAWQERGDVVVKIADTGPGISKEEQSRLFQPFQQASTAIRQRYGGTGLGLSISQSFVELHDGKMWCESLVGEGTTFFFRLPVDPPFIAEANYSSYLIRDWDNFQRTRPMQAPVATVRPCIMVAESGEVVQNIITRYCDGIEVVPVKDTASALDYLSNAPVQAIIVNADEKGFPELVNQINNHSCLPQFTPVFQCNMADLDVSMKDLDIHRYLVKPVTFEKIIQAVELIEKKIENILVVDDEPDALRLISRILTQNEKGYRVMRASDGQEALEILKTMPVDLVFLDLIMPGMDGYRLLEIMDSDPVLRKIDRIVISAKDPHSKSLYSQSLSITCRGGLPAAKILACVEAVRKILSPEDEPSMRPLV